MRTCKTLIGGRTCGAKFNTTEPSCPNCMAMFADWNRQLSGGVAIGERKPIVIVDESAVTDTITHDYSARD